MITFIKRIEPSLDAANFCFKLSDAKIKKEKKIRPRTNCGNPKEKVGSNIVVLLYKTRGECP